MLTKRRFTNYLDRCGYKYDLDEDAIILHMKDEEDIKATFVFKIENEKFSVLVIVPAFKVTELIVKEFNEKYSFFKFSSSDNKCNKCLDMSFQIDTDVVKGPQQLFDFICGCAFKILEDIQNNYNVNKVISDNNDMLNLDDLDLNLNFDDLFSQGDDDDKEVLAVNDTEEVAQIVDATDDGSVEIKFALHDECEEDEEAVFDETIIEEPA